MQSEQGGHWGKPALLRACSQQVPAVPSSDGLTSTANATLISVGKKHVFNGERLEEDQIQQSEDMY